MSTASDPPDSSPDDKLDLHLASADERPAIFRNAHDAWGRGVPIEEYVQRRLISIQHNRAEWHCGTIDGRVVVSLGCYPLSFHMEGRLVPGFAIGAVHTVADCRRRGYAARLIRHLEAIEQARGAEIALLYSDIDPRYYHRLGYQRCPSWEGHCTPSSVPEHQAAALVELEPEPARLAPIYDACHGAAALAIARGPDYWGYLIAKSPGDRFLGLLSAGDLIGYARLKRNKSEWWLSDWAVRPPRTIHLDALMAGIVRVAAREDIPKIASWISREEAFTRRFAITPRRMEITMIKRLADGAESAAEATPAMRAAAEHFQALDHV